MTLSLERQADIIEALEDLIDTTEGLIRTGIYQDLNELSDKGNDWVRLNYPTIADTLDRLDKSMEEDD